MNYPQFFGRNEEEVAQDLLGRTLVVRSGEESKAATIIETAAYEGGKQTPSREGMQYPPGTLFLMSCHGYHLFNIATRDTGSPSCVEVRSVRFAEHTIEGPGRVTKAMGLTPNLDGLVLGEQIEIFGDSISQDRVKKEQGLGDNCLGHYSY